MRLDATPTLMVLTEVSAERRRQDEKFGDQSHLPDRPDDLLDYDLDEALHRSIYQSRPDPAKIACAEAFEHGVGSWKHVLAEEYAEAMAEIGPVGTEPGPELRAELIQVAAVCVAWVEALDKRARRGRTIESLDDLLVPEVAPQGGFRP